MKISNDIPGDWETVKLKDLVRGHNAGIYKKKSLYGKGQNIIGVSDLYQVYAVDGQEFNRAPLGEDETEKFTLKAGNLIYGESSLVKEGIARTLYVTEKGAGTAFAWHTRRYRVHQARVSPKFLYYLLSSSSLRHYFISVATQTALTGITTQDYFNAPIWLPPFPEQRKIAEILGTWDEAITLTERRIEAARQRKKGLMQRLLTGRVRLPEFAGMPWASYRIGDLLKVVKRPVVWDDEDIYNLLSIKRRSGGIFPRKSTRGCDIKTKQMNVTRSGDFLISKMQVVHGAWALNKPAFDGMHISSSYIALVSRDQSKLVIEFFDWLSRLPFMYHLAYLSSHGVHIEKMTFNLQDFLKHIIKIPSTVDEQKKIVTILDNCNREIELLTQKRDALQLQKKGLMQRLLTGRVRVEV